MLTLQHQTKTGIRFHMDISFWSSLAYTLHTTHNDICFQWCLLPIGVCCQLQRCVLPIVAYRMSRWPYQTHAAKRIDRTQTKMVCIHMGTKKRECEEPAGFVQRSSRLAAVKAREYGRWSHTWGRLVTGWDEHLKRPLNLHSWAAKMLKYHGAEWLQEQHILHADGESSSLMAGRTGTRAQSGIVHRRWHDGVDRAQSL